jgi:hypothetical protein
MTQSDSSLPLQQHIQFVIGSSLLGLNSFDFAQHTGVLQHQVAMLAVVFEARADLRGPLIEAFGNPTSEL